MILLSKKYPAENSLCVFLTNSGEHVLGTLVNFSAGPKVKVYRKWYTLELWQLISWQEVFELELETKINQ